MKPLYFYCISCLIVFFSPLGIAEDTYPQTRIQNDQLDVTIYLPDPDKGYYRGSRFDWSGLVQQVKYRDHVFFGDWKTTHNPTNFEDANGLVEEFGMFTPIGYADAKPKETFVKIGIGELLKSKEEDYGFSKYYKVVKPFSWEIKQDKTWIEFHQIIPNWHEWGYDYCKRIELIPGKPLLKITHTFKNTGKKVIHTDHYCHNFVQIDHASINEDYRLDFPFPVKLKQEMEGSAKIEGTKFYFLKTVTKALFSELEGWNPTEEHNGAAVINTKSGAGVRIKGSAAPYKFNFFTAPLATCPEMFVKLDIEPGLSFTWSNTYTFFVNEPDKQ